MEHATRSGRTDFRTDQERTSTENWFGNSASQVSAAAVIDGNGWVTEFLCGCDINFWQHRSHANPSNPTARVSLINLESWHAGYLNESYTGVEHCQSVLGQAISARMYQASAWFHVHRIKKEQPTVRLIPAYMPQHKDTAQGAAVGKSDIGSPYDVNKLLEQIKRYENA